ncbi:hypothetical protein T11_2857, partial [Trichinella zimbabwensis]
LMGTESIATLYLVMVADVKKQKTVQKYLRNIKQISNAKQMRSVKDSVKINNVNSNLTASTDAKQRKNVARINGPRMNHALKNA